MSKTFALRKILVPKDVTEEYFSHAVPGQGSVTYEDGYDKNLHQGEISFSKWLFNTFGGNIRLLNEINLDKVSTPDFLWYDREWDLKTTSTEKSADAAIRHGLKQIRRNPGGIFLDYRGKP